MRYSNLSSLAYWFCLPKFRYHNRQLRYKNLSTTDFIRLSFRRFESYWYSRIFIQWSVWKVLWNWEVYYLWRYRRYRCPDDGDVRPVAAPAGRHARVLPHLHEKKTFELMLSARTASMECHWEQQEPLGGGSWPRTPSSNMAFMSSSKNCATRQGSSFMLAGPSTTHTWQGDGYYNDKRSNKDGKGGTNSLSLKG